jgi:hypothetical protein
MHELPQTTGRLRETLALAFALSFPTLSTWVYFVWLAHDATAAQQTAMIVGKVIQFAFPLVWVLWVCRERLSGNRPGWRGIVEGAPVDCLSCQLRL